MFCIVSPMGVFKVRYLDLRLLGYRWKFSDMPNPSIVKDSRGKLTIFILSRLLTVPRRFQPTSISTDAACGIVNDDLLHCMFCRRYSQGRIPSRAYATFSRVSRLVGHNSFTTSLVANIRGRLSRRFSCNRSFRSLFRHATYIFLGDPSRTSAFNRCCISCRSAPDCLSHLDFRGPQMVGRRGPYKLLCHREDVHSFVGDCGCPWPGVALPLLHRICCTRSHTRTTPRPHHHICPHLPFASSSGVCRVPIRHG